jgi:hypothetical protein
MKDSKGSIRDALQTIREGNSIVAEGRSKDLKDLETLSIAYVDQLRKSKDVKELTKQISDLKKKLGVKEDMDVDVESIEEAPKPAQMKKLGFYGSEIGGLRQGNKYYVAKPVDVKGKVGFRVTDEFGGFETIDLKTFAKRFG